MHAFYALTLGRIQPLMLVVAAVCILAYLGAAQDGTEISKLEADVATMRTQLSGQSLDEKQKEAGYGELSAMLDRLGELRFESGQYDGATKAFVDAVDASKKYHELRYATAKADLKDAEDKLAALIANPNQPNRDVMIPIYRDNIVRNAVTTALSEAKYADDVEAEKKYLTRLNELSSDSNKPADQAEYYEKSGDLEFESGHNDAAFALWDKALQLRQKAGKDEYWTLDYIARARSYLGEFDKALDAYSRIIEITRALSSQPITFKPDDSAAHRESVWMEHGLYQMTLAKALLDTAQIHQMRGGYGAARAAVDEAGKTVD